MNCHRKTVAILFILAVLLCCSWIGHAQAALLMEEPYGFFGALNPTGHAAIYFEHICADTPTRLRPCKTDEMGAVIARYQGISGYDWIAVPLVPYLYATDDPALVPARANRKTVDTLRQQYHDANLLSLGEDLTLGAMLHGGWDELIGASYERRIYAFRFSTTREQDETLIAYLNDSPNRSRFNLLGNNCADFARKLMNFYFPNTFRRAILPDAGITTPKQLARKLSHYARKHPETELAVFEIPQVPGYRRHSRSNKNIAESLVTTPYAIPIVVFNPYVAGGLLADYILHGRFHPQKGSDIQLLSPSTLALLQQIPAKAPDAKDSNAGIPLCHGTDPTVQSGSGPPMKSNTFDQ